MGAPPHRRGADHALTASAAHELTRCVVASVRASKPGLGAAPRDRNPAMTLPACLRAVGAALRDTAVDWFDDDAPRLAASLSFYTALSLAALLLLCISIAGFAVGEDVARGHVSTEAGGLLGEKGAEAVATVLANATDTSQGVLATVVSVVVLLFGALACSASCRPR
jgi:hypothetical protein